MTCDATLSGGPLVCTLPAGHEYGHSYIASWCVDAPKWEEL